MTASSQIIGLLAVVAYLCATAALLFVQKNSADNKPGRRYYLPAIAAVALHAVSVTSLINGDEGLRINFFSALSLTSLLTAVFLLLVSLRQALQILGVVLFPIAGLCVLLATYFPSVSPVVQPGLQWHVMTSVMAYGILVLAATQAITLAVQTHLLRTLQPAGMLSALPPITLMEKLLFQMIGAGFVLLSLSLLTGILFLEDIFAQHLVHKTTLSITAWLIFGTLIAGRLVQGWRGKTALIWTMSGLGFLLVAYFGSKLVLELILAH